MNKKKSPQDRKEKKFAREIHLPFFSKLESHPRAPPTARPIAPGKKKKRNMLSPPILIIVPVVLWIPSIAFSVGAMALTNQWRKIWFVQIAIIPALVGFVLLGSWDGLPILPGTNLTPNDLLKLGIFFGWSLPLNLIYLPTTKNPILRVGISNFFIFLQLPAIFIGEATVFFMRMQTLVNVLVMTLMIGVTAESKSSIWKLMACISTHMLFVGTYTLVVGVMELGSGGVMGMADVSAQPINCLLIMSTIYGLIYLNEYYGKRDLGLAPPDTLEEAMPMNERIPRLEEILSRDSSKASFTKHLEKHRCGEALLLLDALQGELDQSSGEAVIQAYLLNDSENPANLNGADRAELIKGIRNGNVPVAVKARVINDLTEQLSSQIPGWHQAFPPSTSRETMPTSE